VSQKRIKKFCVEATYQTMSSKERLLSLLETPKERPVLIIDSHRCKYSCQLFKELRQFNVERVLEVMDVNAWSEDDLLDVRWLVGVPCLVDNTSLYLGVDAFTKCREISRLSLLLPPK
jgi:hypothetical protein